MIRLQVHSLLLCCVLRIGGFFFHFSFLSYTLFGCLFRFFTKWMTVLQLCDVSRASSCVGNPNVKAYTQQFSRNRILMQLLLHDCTCYVEERRKSNEIDICHTDWKRKELLRLLQRFSNGLDPEGRRRRRLRVRKIFGGCQRFRGFRRARSVPTARGRSAVGLRRFLPPSDSVLPPHSIVKGQVQLSDPPAR